MKIELWADWRNCGYIIGRVTVFESETGNVLMCREDMYYDFDKFVNHLNKMFISNKRFRWEKAVVFKKSLRLKMTGNDLKRE